MDMTPESTPAKRARAKPTKPKVTVKAAKSKAPVVKTAGVKAPVAKQTAPKKARAPRKTLTTSSTAIETPVEVTTMPPSREEVAGMIAIAAYYLAAARNFSPGRELDDWLEAERNIHSQHFG